jgi:hypothetical protein
MSDATRQSDRAFEIMGVYFANCFWNRHYKTATDAVKNGDLFDLTESYKVTIERYNRAFGRQENKDERVNPQYVAVITDLKNYYEEQVNKIRMLEDKAMSVHLSDRDFIDTLVVYMLPQDEYEKIGKYDARKEKYFRMIMTQSVAKFTMFVIRSGTNDAIDKQIRTDKEFSRKYIRNWCDQFISIITGERDQLCNLILASRSGIDISKENMESVPKMVVDRLQYELQTLINEKAELEIKLNKYADYATALKKLFEKEEKKRIKLEKDLRKFLHAPSSVSPVIATPAPYSAIEVPKPTPKLSTTPLIDVIDNTIIKEVSTDDRKAQKIINKLEKEEYSGEDYSKPPDMGKYLEKAGPIKSTKPKPAKTKGASKSDEGDDESGSSYDSDDVVESLDSGDDLKADD